MRTFVALLVLLLILAPGIVACGELDTASDSSAPSDSFTSEALPNDDAEPAEPEPEEDVISWKQAKRHVDELVTVEGPVIGTFYADTSNGEPTFLNVGRDYPEAGRFTVVIWGDDRGNFPDSPESMYAGCTIRVTGVVELYEGEAQIHVSSPGDIEVID